MRSTEHVDELKHGNVLEVDLHGKLSRRDFEQIGPDTERLISRYGKIRLLVTMQDFDGWDFGALWEELKWEARHFNDIERIALIGDERWHRAMASVCKPFTTAHVRYFTLHELNAAYAWVDE
jgi:hypothetical protein